MLAATLPILPNGYERLAILPPQHSGIANTRCDYGLEVATLPSKRVLLYGHDSSVSDTRRMLLESASYQVYAARNSEEALKCILISSIEILILCHTVPCELAESLSVLARAIQPSIKILVLSAGGQSPHQYLADGTHDTCDGPAKFMAKVRSVAAINALCH